MKLGGDAESGFVDVAANALALIILMTVIVLVIAAIPVVRGEVRGDTAPALPFPVEIDPTIMPNSSYWVVTRAGVTLIGLGEPARAMAAGDTYPRLAFGGFQLTTPRGIYRDLSDYEVEYAPDLNALMAAAEPLDDIDARTALVTQIADGFAARQELPTFFITLDGYDSFATLYADLRAADLALRWHVFTGGTVRFVRSVDQFERSIATWR